MSTYFPPVPTIQQSRLPQLLIGHQRVRMALSLRRSSARQQEPLFYQQHRNVRYLYPSLETASSHRTCHHHSNDSLLTRHCLTSKEPSKSSIRFHESTPSLSQFPDSQPWSPSTEGARFSTSTRDQTSLRIVAIVVIKSDQNHKVAHR